MPNIDHYISVGIEKTNSYIFDEKERDLFFQSPSFDEVLQENKKKVKLPHLKLEKYKRTFKFYSSVLFHTCKSNEEFQKVHLFSNLHSITRNKCIHNYRSRINWLAIQCGLSERKFKETLNLLKKDGWVWEDFNPKHLRIKAKTHLLHHYGLFDELGKMPDFGVKCVTVEYDKNITLNQLKTLTLELKQGQKTHAELDRVFKIKEVEKSKIKMTKEMRDILKKYCLSKLANFDTTAILYLQDIQKLFGFSAKSTASRLITTLQKDNCLEKHHQFKRKRYIESIDDEINPRFEKSCSKVYDIVYQQLANRLQFKLPFTYQKNKFVKFMDSCIKEYLDKVLSYREKYIDQTKGLIRKKRYRKMMETKISPTKIGVVKIYRREEFYNSNDILCGVHSFVELKHYDMFSKLKKTQRIKSKVVFYRECIDGYSVQLMRDDEVGDWEIKMKRGSSMEFRRCFSKSKFGGYYFLYSKGKLDSSESSMQLLLGMMDRMWRNPIRDARGRYMDSDVLLS